MMVVPTATSFDVLLFRVQFFVASDPNVKTDRLWHDKYSLRKSMIPSFITMDQSHKVHTHTQAYTQTHTRKYSRTHTHTVCTKSVCRSYA